MLSHRIASHTVQNRPFRAIFFETVFGRGHAISRVNFQIMEQAGTVKLGICIDR
jgi:hypothetical protein